MTDPSQPPESVERCPDYDVANGRCQLVAEHPGQHATDVGDACMTWLLGEAQYWRWYPAPHWIIELPWASGFQPAVHERRQSSLV
jgi:hypothetical protein